MELRSYKGLSDYLVTETGGVIVASTFAKVEPVNKNYVLTTDEQFKTITGGTARLVRRFTVDQVKKMFADGTKVNVDKPISEQKQPLEPEPAATTPAKAAAPKNKKVKAPKAPKPAKESKEAQKVVHNGVTYESARKAAKALNISVNTVINKAKAGKDGFTLA